MAFFNTTKRLRHCAHFPFTRISKLLSNARSLHSVPFTICLIPQAFHRAPYRLPSHPGDFNAQTKTMLQSFCLSDQIGETHECNQLVPGDVLEKVRKAKDFDLGDEAMAFLDTCGMEPDVDLIRNLIWALRDEWKLAFLVFKWGEKLGCVVERTWCSMIWVLGNNQKFGVAWTVIGELHRRSKDTQQAILILIDRYAAANYPDEAVRTFHLMQRFKFSPDQDAYLAFLTILCRHGNIEEAEEFMYLNKKFFPLETESFNIILHAWCKIAVDMSEARRVWREMSKNCIEPNGTSYSSMISCYSSAGDLFNSLRLYDEMKARGWIPSAEVYHSLIYVLARENCSKEALKIVELMKEKGLKPDSNAYNFLIRPLCEAGKFKEARNVLSKMIEDDISPTIDTYHSLIVGEDIEGILGVLIRMRKAGLGPNRDTFVVILSKCFKSGRTDDAKRIWAVMIDEHNVKPDREHYRVFVEGLAKHGLIAEAGKAYEDMISYGMMEDSSLKKLLERPTKDGSNLGKENGSRAEHIKRGKVMRFRRRVHK